MCVSVVCVCVSVSRKMGWGVSAGGGCQLLSVRSEGTGSPARERLQTPLVRSRPSRRGNP